MTTDTKSLVKRHMRCSKKRIDKEISKIINEQMDRAINLVKSKRNEIHKLSQKLLERDVLSFMEVNEILGERPFEPHENFKRFLNEVLHKPSDFKPAQEYGTPSPASGSA